MSFPDPKLQTEVLRLKNRSDFLHAHRFGRKKVTDAFLLQCRHRRDGGPDGVAAEPDHSIPRIGFTASKKVGNSVARSRAKRRLRALAHEVLTQENFAKPKRDYVLIAKPQILDACFQKMKADLLRSLDDIEKPKSNFRSKMKNKRAN